MSRWTDFVGSLLGSALAHVLYAQLHRGRLDVFHFVPNEPQVKALPPPLFLSRIKRHGRRETEAGDATQ